MLIIGKILEENPIYSTIITILYVSNIKEVIILVDVTKGAVNRLIVTIVTDGRSMNTILSIIRHFPVRTRNASLVYYVHTIIIRRIEGTFKV